MAYETLADFDCAKTVSIGGIREDRKTGKRYKNPTSIEGYYVGTKSGIENKLNPEKPMSLHIIKTAEGNTGVWGKTDLDRKMSTAKVGLKTLIQFDKMVPTNKKPMFKYIVKRDKLDVDHELQTSSDTAEAYEGVDSPATADASEYGEEVLDEVLEEEAPLGEEVAADEPPPVAAKPPKAATAPSPQRETKRP